MKPQIIKNDRYIEIIGHYDSEILCAKLTLLTELYAIEHREGYAKFDIKDEDKLELIDDRLEFIKEPLIVVTTITINGTTINGVYEGNTILLRNDGLYNSSENELVWTASPSSGQTFLGLSRTEGATTPDSGLVVGDSFTAYMYSLDSTDFYPVYGTPLSTGHTLTYSGDLSSYLDVKVNNVSVSSGYKLNHGDKIELFLDDNYPYYEILIDGEEIIKSNITILNKDIDIKVNEIHPYLTFSSPNTFTLEINDHLKYWDGTIEYSTDIITWSTWDGTTVLSSSQSGAIKYLYIRGSNNTYITGNNASIFEGYWKFIGSSISCNGNIENLLDYQTVVSGNHPTMAQKCYQYMFHNCAALISAPELPATTLVERCYSDMFFGCTSLITAPKLPATILAKGCYAGMFGRCASLTTAPELPATTLQAECYWAMFSECTSLTSAPELPSTGMVSYCYQAMFSHCTSLITAPKLPARILAYHCYMSMFNGCTSLTTPAIMVGGTTQATANGSCCYQMYYNCTSLRIYTTSNGHTPFYRAIAYSTSSGTTEYQSSYQMFYNCKVNGSISTNDYFASMTPCYY